MRKLLTAFFMASCAAPLAAAGIQDEMVLLAEPARAARLCEDSLPVNGIACVKVDEERAGSIASNQNDNDELWRQISAGTKQSMGAYRQEAGVLNGFLGRSFRIALVLIDRQTDVGASYFGAFPVVFSTTAFTPGATRLATGEVPDFVTRQFSESVKLAQPDSTQAQNFWKRLDAPILSRRSMEEREAKRAAEEARKQTPEYKAESAASYLRACAYNIASARKGIEREQQIAKISGVANKVSLYTYGSMIANCEEAMPRLWKTYKQNGGTATSMNEILEPR